MTPLDTLVRDRLGRANSATVAIAASALFIAMATLLGAFATDPRASRAAAPVWVLRGPVSALDATASARPA